MSNEICEQLKGRLELYSLIEEGLEDERQGKIRPFSEALNDIRKEINLQKNFNE